MIRAAIGALAGSEMQGASPEHAEDVACRLLGDIGASGSDGDAPGRGPMSDVVTEEEKRLIAVDAKAAAKNGFPQ
eukprot:5925477-Alexandrium_andersonii.AAC.1